MTDRAAPGRLSATAGALTVGAGLVHAAAIGAHVDHRAVVVLFALTALAQVTLGGAMVGRPSRPVLVAGAAVNLLVVGAWALSRTSGLPLVDALSAREAVGLQDLTATLLEGVAVVAALVAIRDPAPRPVSLSPALVLALVPALVGMTAPHRVADDHHAAAAAPAADLLFSGADASHATRAQLDAARRLILTTRESVAARFPDEASLVAAGYRSIGDGVVSQYEHFLKAEYLADGRELDPAHVESVVLQQDATGKRVVSALYILETGKTMADVPDVAGELTTWHDHQNLCWDRTGTRLAGLLIGGRCVPGGTFRPTPPMLHVWLVDHPCGPFAGIEGQHGTGCAHQPH